MVLIFSSFLLSFRVLARVAFPALGILLLSVVFWIVVGIFTLGISGLISGPATAAFLSLVGIRAALSFQAPLPSTEFKLLAAYSVAYGVMLAVGKKALVTASILVAIFATTWSLEGLSSAWSLEDADQSVQTMFVLRTVSLHAILSAALLAALPAALAVPMAGMAHSLSAGAPSRGIFEGFGRSFLPLCLIFFLCTFFLFFFHIFSFIFILVPFALAKAYADLVSFNFSAIEIDFVLKAVGALLALGWVNAWMWAASALAFRKYEETNPAGPAGRAKAAQPAPEIVTQDIRALRKARG